MRFKIKVTLFIMSLILLTMPLITILVLWFSSNNNNESDQTSASLNFLRNSLFNKALILTL